MVSSLFPIIATPDLDRLLAFYRDALGGRVSYEYPGGGEKPVYVALELGASQLGLGLEHDIPTGPDGQRVSLWVYVDDCDAVVQRLRGAAAEVVEEPVDQPWGERVAMVRDPDGNLVRVASRPVA